MWSCILARTLTLLSSGRLGSARSPGNNTSRQPAPAPRFDEFDTVPPTTTTMTDWTSTEFAGTTTAATAKVTATATSTTAAATEVAALVVTGKTASAPVKTTTDVEAATSAGTVKTTMTTTTTGYVEKKSGGRTMDVSEDSGNTRTTAEAVYSGDDGGEDGQNG